MQPFLRKGKGESKNMQIIGDSRIAKMDCHDFANAKSRNDENSVDCHESLRDSRNDESGVDCHENPTDFLAMTENNESAKSRNDESLVDCFDSGKYQNLAMAENFAKSMQDLPKSELNTQTFTIHILDFPGFGYAKVSKAERDSWDKNLSVFLKKRESIKLFIHLIDSRHTNLALDNEIRAFLRSNLRADADILEVFTKADKLKKSEIRAFKGKILVSVTKKDLGCRGFKDSIESLRHAILRTMYHI